MNHRLLYFAIGILGTIVSYGSIKSGNTALVVISASLMAFATAAAIILKPKRKVMSPSPPAPKPELSNSVVMHLTAAEKRLLALALFALGMEVGKDSFETVGRLAIKMDVHKELSRLMSEMAEKERANKN
jgi:hypothetical protein